MMGFNASYPFARKLTASFFVVNGYWHLAHANNVPSWGGQAAITATSHLTIKQTVMVGPHQTSTAGPDGGFFRGRVVSPGVIGQVPGQNLLIFATIFTFDR